jgi:hypothetical protein
MILIIKQLMNISGLPSMSKAAPLHSVRRLIHLIEPCEFVKDL